MRTQDEHTSEEKGETEETTIKPVKPAAEVCLAFSTWSCVFLALSAFSFSFLLSCFLQLLYEDGLRSLAELSTASIELLKKIAELSLFQSVSIFFLPICHDMKLHVCVCVCVCVCVFVGQF